MMKVGKDFYIKCDRCGCIALVRSVYGVQAAEQVKIYKYVDGSLIESDI